MSANFIELASELAQRSDDFDDGAALDEVLAAVVQDRLDSLNDSDELSEEEEIAARQAELHQKITGKRSDSDDTDELSETEKKQKKLREKMTGDR